MTNQNNNLQITQKEATTTILNRLDKMTAEGLEIPSNYNAANALNTAYLKLVDMKVNGQPLLNVVTKKSIYESLLNMVLQGLSPAKNQVYFIPYGTELQMQRSYKGTQAVIKRLDGVKDIWANVIYDGDDFEMKINDEGVEEFVKHDTNWMNRDNEIIGAYAIVETDNGQLLEVMTRKQIEASWSQAKTKKVHDKFGDQMAKRTVINRAAKNVIDTSDDSDTLIHAINQTTENEFDPEERRKDVTEAPQSETTENLLEDFKKNQPKQQTPEEPKEVPIEEKEEENEMPFGDVANEEPPAEAKEEYNPFDEIENTEYADFEEVEEIDFSKKTMDEIKEMLDEKNVPYKATAKRDELVAVAEMTLNGGGMQDELF